MQITRQARERCYIPPELTPSDGAAPQKQQALLGQMLLEGYGCERDPTAGREWVDKAKRRGYRMEGVYCEL